MRKDSIVVNYKRKESIIDQVSKEFKRLKILISEYWEMTENNVIYYDGSFASANVLIKLGGLQKAIKDLAFFQQGWSDITGISLCLCAGHKWEEVIDRMQEIESIEG